MRLLDYGIFLYLLNRMAGGAALAFTVLVGVALFVLVFGSLVGSIAHTRTTPAGKEQKEPQHRLVEGQGQTGQVRDWEQIRREQLRQLGLDKQGRRQAPK